MSGEDVAPPPSVMWAQRADTVLLTICLEDCTKPEIEIKPDSVSFSGIGGPEKKLHKVVINLFKEVDPEKSIHSVRDRLIEFILKKKEGESWPRLTKEKIKMHWLRVDFTKWVDEEDYGDEDEGFQRGVPSINDMLMNMDGDGMGNNPFKPSMDELDVDGEDSDDGDLPDLE